METCKRSRSNGNATEHNGLKLHPTRQFPLALERRILDFVPAFELGSLLDASRACRSLVEHYFASTDQLSLDYDSLGFPRPTASQEVRIMNSAMLNCRRLKRLYLHEEAGPSLHRQQFAGVFATQIIQANAATLQEFDILTAKRSATKFPWSADVCLALANCPNLTKLRFTSPPVQRQPGFQAAVLQIVSRCSKISELTVTQNDYLLRLDEQALVTMMQAPLCLTSLHATDLTPPALLHLAATSHVGLRTLQLVWTEAQWHATLRSIVECLSEQLPRLGRLEAFTFDYPDSDYDDPAAEIMWNLPAATSVSVSLRNQPEIVAPKARKLLLELCLQNSTDVAVAVRSALHSPALQFLYVGSLADDDSVVERADAPEQFEHALRDDRWRNLTDLSVGFLLNPSTVDSLLCANVTHLYIVCKSDVRPEQVRALMARHLKLVSAAFSCPNTPTSDQPESKQSASATTIESLCLPALQSLSFGLGNNALLQDLWLPELQTLRLGGARVKIDSFEQYLDQMPDLEELVIENDAAVRFSAPPDEPLEDVHTLRYISGSAEASDLKAAFLAFPNITSLSVHDGGDHKRTATTALKALCAVPLRELTHFTLSPSLTFDPLDPVVLGCALQSCPDLRVLWMPLARRSSGRMQKALKRVQKARQQLCSEQKCFIHLGQRVSHDFDQNPESCAGCTWLI